MASTAENVIRATRRTAHANGADLARLRKNFDRTVRRARKSANRGIGATDAYVHKHPWTSVGVAAGVAALAGIALFAALRPARPAQRALVDGLEELRRAALERLGEIRR